MNEQRRCLVIDGHPTVRLGIRGLLAGRYEVDEAEDCETGLELVTSIGAFDVAIVELSAQANRPRGGFGGKRAIRALRRAHPGLGIVAHAASPDPAAAADALEAGAAAFVAKTSPCEALAAAVEAAAEAERYVDPATTGANGNGGLTRRQREILQLYADGLSTEDVAERLERSLETIRTHTKGALSRLEARDRAHAVAIGLRKALIE